MLLTITYNGENVSDLGYLLHKNPARPQTIELSFGKAHVFYPEVSAERCTAALLLDIDPLDLARGKEGSGSGGLFDYVNDRPYVSSSFMCTAISQAFGTAMSGRCEKRQALADTPLRLSARITMLPCKQASFKGAALNETTFKGATLKGTTLKGTTFKGAMLKGTMFKGAGPGFICPLLPPLLLGSGFRGRLPNRAV
jgi:hypothetical protein